MSDPKPHVVAYAAVPTKSGSAETANARMKRIFLISLNDDGALR
jgi:hypothetical protein